MTCSRSIGPSDALVPKHIRGEKWVKEAERLVLQCVPNIKEED